MKVSVNKFKITKTKSGKKKVKLFWKKQSKVAGYQIRYAKEKNMRHAKTVKVSRNLASKTIKKLKTKKHYYFQIRAYAKDGNKMVYGKWSNKKSVKVK